MLPVGSTQPRFPVLEKKNSWAGGVICHPLMYRWGGRYKTFHNSQDPSTKDFKHQVTLSLHSHDELNTRNTSWDTFSALSNCAVGPRHGISKDEGSSARTSVPSCSVRPLMTLSCRRERVNMVSPAIRAWHSKLRLKPGSAKGSGKNY